MAVWMQEINNTLVGMEKSGDYTTVAEILQGNVFGCVSVPGKLTISFCSVNHSGVMSIRSYDLT